MRHPDSHLSDQQLLLSAERELPPREEKLVQAHLSGCWKCRTRRQELEVAIADFIQCHERSFEAPPAPGPRALLRAGMAALSAAQQEESRRWRVAPAWKAIGAICAVLLLGFGIARLAPDSGHRTNETVSAYYMPDARLTPGATVLLTRSGVCSRPGDGNKAVPLSLQRQVFQEYGIPGADPQAFEVDYLVTPALGGSDDIHNLWPHSQSAIWNAYVKDALEDRLREMVCDGSLDLNQAQKEIATDWISAYKKYFHTEQPLPNHRKHPARMSR
jgi:hypothetical protein